jgi:hypothetical protein
VPHNKGKRLPVNSVLWRLPSMRGGTGGGGSLALFCPLFHKGCVATAAVTAVLSLSVLQATTGSTPVAPQPCSRA